MNRSDRRGLARPAVDAIARTGDTHPIMMQLFQRQYRSFGSFGATIGGISQRLDKMAGGMDPVIDTERDRKSVV